jgi:GxxExxY protein
MNDWVKECAEEVFKEMGSGHSESVYEASMAIEIGSWGAYSPLIITRQVPVPLSYKGFTVGVGIVDLLINGALVVELKAVTKITPKDEQQVKKYLEALDLDYGLIINFGTDLEFVEVERSDHGKTPTAPY